MTETTVTPPRQRPIPSQRRDFLHFEEITTRWNDNDVYGHMNNAVHYGLFDSVVNRWLHDVGKQDPRSSDLIGLVVHSSCDYHAELAYPDKITAGLRIDSLGRTSVTYRVALFSENRETSAAEGVFVHVYVDRAARKPAPIADGLRAAMTRLQRSEVTTP